MNVKTILVSITSGLLLISSLSPALADGKGEWRQRMAGPGQHGQIWQQLDLSDQQRQQIRELMQAHRAAKPAAQGDAMQALLEAPQFDEQAARDLLAQRAAQREQRQLAGLKLQHEIRQLLTGEQREQLQQLQQQRHNKRHDKARQHRQAQKRTTAS
jgi:protein CpxP